MAQRMGMGMAAGLGPADSFRGCKRRFRWMLSIDGVCGVDASVLPLSQAARPSLSFREATVEHVSETVYVPTKPDWKPISITLFDLATNGPHPVFGWIRECFDVSGGGARFNAPGSGFMRRATLKMLDGCGETIEKWVYDGAWPQSADFGRLDMADNEVVTCELTLRYCRAYVE